MGFFFEVMSTFTYSNLFLFPNFQLLNSQLTTKNYHFKITFTEVAFKYAVKRKDCNTTTIWSQVFRITRDLRLSEKTI